MLCHGNWQPHVLRMCSSAAIWSALCLQDLATSVDALWLPSPLVPVAKHAQDLCLSIILWEIWKARNDLVFNAHHCSSHAVLLHVIVDIDLWSRRINETGCLADVTLWRSQITAV
jgi:hypothetical protein